MLLEDVRTRSTYGLRIMRRAAWKNKMHLLLGCSGEDDCSPCFCMSAAFASLMLVYALFVVMLCFFSLSVPRRPAPHTTKARAHCVRISTPLHSEPRGRSVAATRRVHWVLQRCKPYRLHCHLRFSILRALVRLRSVFF